MKLLFKRELCFAMPEAFYTLLNNEVIKAGVKPEVTTIILNFSDPTYSATNGGFHSVEIMLTKQSSIWALSYATDLAYHGAPYPELVKEIDVCFTAKRVYHLYGGWLNKRESAELAALFIDNFIEYYKMGVYTVEIS
ncbi:MAG: DUF2787 family protein [Colwellia sp.]